MDIREIEQLSPVDGERIPESRSWLWAGVGVSIFAMVFGGALVWAWQTKFVLYETEEVRVITPSDQLEAAQEGREIPREGLLGKPIPVKTQHVVGFTYGVLGSVVLIAGAVLVPLIVYKYLVYLIERPTLIIGKKCFQLVVREDIVRVHVPYQNIKQVGLLSMEDVPWVVRWLSAPSIGVNFRDPNDPTMHGPNARTVKSNKKWTGWDYAIPAPADQVCQTLQQAIKQAHEES